MDLYYTSFSPSSRSVLLTAKALGIDLNKNSLNLMENENMSPEFTEINPQHCVPTLVDGDLTLWESRAICTYLVNKYGEDDSLYPSDPVTRALIDRFLYFDMGTLYKRFTDYVQPILFSGAEPDEDKLAALQEALQWFDGFLDGHDFCVGDNLTVADFCLSATTSTIKEADIDLSSYENVTGWLDRCESQIEGYESENLSGAQQFGEFFKSKTE